MAERAEDVHILEGSDSNQVGGLILRKKASDHMFKKPSTLGLDKLAEEKRRENSERASSSRSKHNSRDRKYRLPADETPTHTGGVNTEAKQRLDHRLKRQKLDAVNSRKSDRYKSDDYNRREHQRYYKNDRDHSSREHSRSRSNCRDTPRFKDEPQTPKLRTRVFF